MGDVDAAAKLHHTINPMTQITCDRMAASEDDGSVPPE
jgi:hypothetical protein